MSTYSFARQLSGRLARGRIFVPPLAKGDQPSPFVVTGWIGVGEVEAAIVVSIRRGFDELRTVPPMVWCHERWMRKNPDWHNHEETGLCWVLDHLWRDAMNWQEKPRDLVVSEGVDWLFNDVQCLVTRHYVGHIRKMTLWPREWKQWSHGDEGRSEYERERLHE